MLGLLLSDSACANTPPALAGIPTLDGVGRVSALVSLFSDGVPLDIEGGALVVETVAEPVANRLLVLLVPDVRNKALNMLVEVLPTLPEPNALPVLLDEPSLKKPPLLWAGAENVNPAGVVAGVGVPLELAMDGLAAVTCTLDPDCQIQGYQAYV